MVVKLVVVFLVVVFVVVVLLVVVDLVVFLSVTLRVPYINLEFILTRIFFKLGTIR